MRWLLKPRIIPLELAVTTGACFGMRLLLSVHLHLTHRTARQLVTHCQSCRHLDRLMQIHKANQAQCPHQTRRLVDSVTSRSLQILRHPIRLPGCARCTSLIPVANSYTEMFMTTARSVMLCACGVSGLEANFAKCTATAMSRADAKKYSTATTGRTTIGPRTHQMSQTIQTTKGPGRPGLP